MWLPHGKQMNAIHRHPYHIKCSRYLPTLPVELSEELFLINLIFLTTKNQPPSAQMPTVSNEGSRRMYTAFSFHRPTSAIVDAW